MVEMDLFSANFSKSSIFDFEGIRGRGGASLLMRCSSMFHCFEYMNMYSHLSIAQDQQGTGGEASVYGMGTDAGAVGNQNMSGWGHWRGPMDVILHRQGSMVLGRPIWHGVHIQAVLDVLALSRG